MKLRGATLRFGLRCVRRSVPGSAPCLGAKITDAQISSCVDFFNAVAVRQAFLVNPSSIFSRLFVLVKHCVRFEFRITNRGE